MTSDTTTNPPVTEDANTQVTVELLDGKVTTTSIDVARHFGKRHDHVLRDIENLIVQLPQEYLPNFGVASFEVEQPNGGKVTYPAYRITRDGFTLLAMGFTGKRALQFKLAYIDAFNRMEEQLAQQKDKALADAENNAALAVTMALLSPAVSDWASFRPRLATTPLPFSLPSALRKPGHRTSTYEVTRHARRTRSASAAARSAVSCNRLLGGFFGLFCVAFSFLFALQSALAAQNAAASAACGY